MHFSTKLFMVNKITKVMFTEISDLGVRLPRSPFVRVYHDSVAEGLILLSHHSGKKATFYISHIEKDADQDVRWWTLFPTVETLREIPQLRGWKVELFND